MADREGDRRSAASAHRRVDALLLEVREHVVGCATETRQQNARLRRVERILVSTAGATIVLLLTLVIR
jgi:hypothetical protein